MILSFVGGFSFKLATRTLLALAHRMYDHAFGAGILIQSPHCTDLATAQCSAACRQMRANWITKMYKTDKSSACKLKTSNLRSVLFFRLCVLYNGSHSFLRAIGIRQHFLLSCQLFMVRAMTQELSEIHKDLHSLLQWTLIFSCVVFRNHHFSYGKTNSRTSSDKWLV